MMKKQHITLSDEDRSYLQNYIKDNNTPARKKKRALVLLELNRGSTFKRAAEIADVTHQSASAWAAIYRESSLAEVLTDKPIPGRGNRIDGISRAKITALACSDAPDGYENWSLRLLADKVVELGYVDTISHTEIGRLLKKINSNRT